ncbi:MAG: hypothetical protein CMG66_05920 [Candidatus Marinimicrobia bacterium]|nr:hypothetical protein [Candidatus Neomarinimicrobiota bacterium]|tara:strand:+ start:21976 stop:24912 length:2937 start_codon:yes stop_codon:yes gene_type:complete
MKTMLSKIKSWDELKRKLSKLDNKQKGDAFELLSKYYLLLDPKYKSILSDVWLLDEVPLAVSKKLHLPSSDQGIDLIAKTKQGEYWAVQCKYRQEDSSSLRWKEISTFLGLVHSRCKNISYSLITTTKDRLARVLDDADNLGLLAGDTWRGLDDDFFKRLRAALKNKKVKIKPYKPFKHQKRAIKNAVNHFIAEKESRGKMIMPCGAGKSLTAYWMAESLQAKSILIAVPSLSLVRQTLNAWLREVEANNINAEWICVCSDKTVGNLKADEIEYLNHDLAVPALTDVNYIAKWLRKRRNGLSIVFTTYQSGKVISKATKIAKKSFDLGIMDEAHKTVGNKDKNFAHLLFDKNIKIKKRCFMTATERRFQGSKDDIISMDDIDVYGDTFDLLSFKEALEQKPPILSDYKIITIGVSEDSIKEMIKKNFFIKPDKGAWTNKMEAEMMAALIALRKAIRGNNIKHALSFHSSIQKAKIFANNQSAFTEVFPNYWNLDAFHVSGKMNTSERDKIIKEDFINSKRALITNARCLTEGVDVPDIDCVLFADPKKSTIDIVQAVGRALRIKEDKKFGYVIVPVILEKEKDFKDTKAYESILMVLRALAANDDRIIEYFKAKNNNQRTNVKIDIQIDERIAKGINTKEFKKDIHIHMWHRLAKLSWMPFEEARAFVNKLNLKNTEEWKAYCKSEGKPIDIPNIPRVAYKDKGWIGMSDWLGTGNKIPGLPYRDFKKARAFAHSLNLQNEEEWNKYCKSGQKPQDIPSSPWKAYKNKGYTYMGDWLGTGKIPDRFKLYKSFEKGRAFVHKLQLNSMTEFIKYSKSGKIPEDIPRYPARYYKNKGWISSKDWLGQMKDYKGPWQDFEKVKAFVQSLNIRSHKEWKQYCESGNKPIDIPSNPYGVYKNKGWIDAKDFFGYKKIKKRPDGKFRTFKQARKYVHKLNIRGQIKWLEYCKSGNKPKDIPVTPWTVYKNKGWKGLADFLGYDK